MAERPYDAYYKKQGMNMDIYYEEQLTSLQHQLAIAEHKFKKAKARVKHLKNLGADRGNANKKLEKTRKALEDKQNEYISMQSHFDDSVLNKTETKLGKLRDFFKANRKKWKETKFNSPSFKTKYGIGPLTEHLHAENKQMGPDIDIFDD